MTNNLDFQSVQKPLAEAKNILIAAAANPKLDYIAAGLALYLSFKKQGKNVSIACPTAMTVSFNRLIGVNKVSSKVGNRNLLISFDYIKDSIEKVSYNIENNKFNLVVEPKPNFPPLDTNKVSYSYTGVNADVIVIIGASKLEDLQTIYAQEKKIFSDKLTINIDNGFNNSRFGKINFHNSKASSCSEIVVKVIRSLNMPIDEDVATNLYSGLKSGSTNFQAPNVNADTFELAAFLLKNGAKKDQLAVSPQSAGLFKPTGQPNINQNINFTPSPPSVKLEQPAPPFIKNNKQEKKTVQPPPDWFKPKIYKGDKAV